MQITQQCVAFLRWTLTDTFGEDLDELDQPVEFLIGGDDLLAVIESALQGCSAGSSVNLQIEPEQGFGEYNEQLVFLESRSLFPADLEEGMTFDGMALPAGCSADLPREQLYTVTDIYPDHVVLDCNHQLAGIALRLQIKGRAVREATVEEIGHGTVTGAGFFKVVAMGGLSP